MGQESRILAQTKPLEVTDYERLLMYHCAQHLEVYVCDFIVRQKSKFGIS